MTTPPATHTAADGTVWEYYDFRVVNESDGRLRHVRVPLGAERAEYRKFRAPARPDLGVLCYRFGRVDYRADPPARVLDQQIARAMALRAAGAER